MEFIDLKAQQARIRADIDRRIAAVLDHGRYVMGPELHELEERLSGNVGVKHCIGVSSGTDSLLIALLALGIGPGDEVITVPYTFVATAEVMTLLGVRPVFVDIEPDTWNIDPTMIEAALTERTKAIMPVGIFGQTANMTAINEIAARNGNLPVIEDAAQSFGATHSGLKSCALSTIGSTSFFPSKPLGAYGDGGALFTDDDDLAKAMRLILNHGQERRDHHPRLGLNGRLDTLQAAVLLVKMSIFEDEIEQRQAVAKSYAARLSDLPIEQQRVDAANRSVYAQYTIQVEDPGALSAALKEGGVPSMMYYHNPLHLQPVFAYLGHKRGDFPVTEHVASRGLSLPMNPYLTEGEVERVCTAVANFF